VSSVSGDAVASAESAAGHEVVEDAFMSAARSARSRVDRREIEEGGGASVASVEEGDGGGVRSEKTIVPPGPERDAVPEGGGCREPVEAVSGR
jgi:hypothetical protein